MKNNTKYFLFGLSLLCVCMIGITTIKGSILNPLRTAVGYVLVPIQSGVNRVGGGLYNELSSVGKLKTALAENETLKTRVDELTEENTRLRSEQFELERLRSLYELDQESIRSVPGSSQRTPAPGFPYFASTKGLMTESRRT